MTIHDDNRTILTLDAGGTNYVFSAIRGGKQIGDSITLPADAVNLRHSIELLKEGFSVIAKGVGENPSAISFAFPGPADYRKGIIFNINNMPAFAGGVPLADILFDEFKIPVFINNDGDLFAYGEAVAGFLPQLNAALEKAGNPKRYSKLFGVTVGTGFGGGFSADGKPYLGDNDMAAEIWTSPNKVKNGCFVEESVCIRAVQKNYAARVGLKDYAALSPKDIEDIALGKREGDKTAAAESYRELGVAMGHTLAYAAAFFDCPIVIGGGLSKGYRLFLDAAIAEMNSTVKDAQGKDFRRLIQNVYNLEDPAQFEEFTRNSEREFAVPGTNRKVLCDPVKRIGVGISKIGTSRAISAGAYAFALSRLK